METKLSHISKRIMAWLILLFVHLSVIAQDVADSDLSNRAGTNKNFRDQWWLFGVIALVVVIVMVAYSRRRGRRT